MRRFDEVLYSFNDKIKAQLQSLSDDVKDNTYEIRLRVNQPIMLSIPRGAVFLSQNRVCNIYRSGLPIASSDDINDCLVRLCEYSVYSYENQIKQGFIGMRHGHRAGICGTAVYDNKGLITFKNISSVNIRIARQSIGCADRLFSLFRDGLHSVVIAGAPSSGKTTILRDFARQMSTALYRVAVIDERYEIAASVDGVPGNDLGPSCDIISGCDKSEAIKMAVRTLAPQIILFDEIGSANEAEAVKESFRCGVPIVTTIHAGSINEALYRLQLLSLDREFDTILLRGGAPCEIAEIYSGKEPMAVGI